jgi:hypothetical protein
LDEHNERLVFKRIVENDSRPPRIASDLTSHLGQNFLITPKLLPNLYDMEVEAMTVLCFLNGPHNFESPLDWNKDHSLKLLQGFALPKTTMLATRIDRLRSTLTRGVRVLRRGGACRELRKQYPLLLGSFFSFCQLNDDCRMFKSYLTVVIDCFIIKNNKNCYSLFGSYMFSFYAVQCASMCRNLAAAASSSSAVGAWLSV